MKTDAKKKLRKAKFRLRKWRAAKKKELGGVSYEQARNLRTTTPENDGKKRRWTLEEDACVMVADGLTDHQIALSLGRTEFAVRTRRAKLVSYTKPA